MPDVRPYLQHAQVVVAPMRLARGVQNKVLEAMAMGLADEIASDPRAAAREAGVEARWDLSAYARPPASNADPELSDETVSRIAAEVVTRLDARALPTATDPDLNPNEDIERRRRHLAARLLQPAA